MTRPSLIAAASVLALMIGTGGRAVAQDSLRIGASVDAALGDGDGRGPDDDYVYDDYRFEGRRGQRLEAVLRSGDFDAYLEVRREGSYEVLAEDDDGLGDGTDARLRFTPSEDGAYLLRARTLSGLEGGDYSLSLQERPRPPRAPRPTGVRLGQTLNGTLSDRDPEQEEGGRYDAFVFRAAEGQRVVVTLDSDDFDSLVRVGRMNGPDFEELAQNDDAPGGGLNSRLVFTAPAAGDYVIRATALSDGEGDYSVGLAEAPPPPPSKPLDIGAEIEGAIGSETGTNDDGQRADLYRFAGTAGQRIAVQMESDDFDTYLVLRRLSDNAVLAEDDDGLGDGTDSRLVHTLDQDGDYLIEARAFGEEGEGDYDLSLSDVPPPPAPVAAAFGQTLEGEIADDDPQGDGGKRYDAYAFSGTEGQRVQVIMRSGDFDAYLEVGEAGEDFVALASDDDGLAEGTDARLNFTVPETGDYVIRAQPLGADGRGLYSLEFIDRGPEPAPGSILIGATARGTLSETDAISDEGAYYDAYRFQAKKDEKLRITMVSNAFDAFIDIGEDGEDFTSMASDDDGLSDTHARLDWTAPEDGWYVIRARSYGPNDTGAYALTLERQPPAATRDAPAAREP